MDKERFSLLLLDPGEIYFEDFSAYLLPVSVPASSLTASYFEKHKQIGRIKMCSKSIVFDPKDVMKPILKIPLKECSKISECNAEVLFKISSNSNAISIECRQYVEMMEGNVLLPYAFNLKTKNFLFLLNYAKLSDCLPPICQLHRASTLPAAEQNSMIAAIVYSRQNRVSFDTLWLDDLYEQVILETQGNKITPLVINPGRILLTSSRLYFQPYNNIDSYPVLKVHLQDVKRVVKRRFLLQHLGLEVYCGNNKQVTHLYLTLKSTEDRDTLYDGLLAQHTLQLDDADQEVMTLQWQNGALSNYDYLLYLNSLADRTFNDLTQYPVFPWVVSDYTSTKLDLKDPKTFRDLTKPIGALNETRLSRLKERYEEMPPPKFLYGSHYSTPGFVLFYMVRKFPHLMLCLQNGRFDHPDRMFNSVSDTWSNVLKNMSDFKELIPAFYDTEENGDFCVNTYGINFGYRQDGSKIGDVKLPPWANGPKDFVKQLRDALESDHVSRYLNHWIDLIFGYKQVGAEAEKANNVFYYLCYEGAVDLDSIKEMNQRHALEVQIMEFGQIPKQIFTRPHPHRVLGLPAMMPANSELSPSEDTRDVFHPRDTTTCNIMRWQNVDSLQITASFQSHKEAVTSVAIAKSNEFVVSVGQDSLLKIYTMSDKRQVRSLSLSTMPLSSCIILSDDKTLVVGSWDNNVTLYNLEFGRVLSSVRVHEDAVSRLVWGKTSNVLVSGSWDCSVRVWNGIGDGRPFKLATSLAAELDHEAYITCLTLDRTNKWLVSGTQDGELFLWSLESNSLLQKLPGHSATVNAASFSPDGSKLVSCGDDNNFKVLDLTSRMQVYCKTLNEELKCLAWDGFTLFLGGSNGSLYIWDLIKVEMLKQIQAHNGPLLAIAVSDDGTIVVTAGQDHRVLIWESGS